MRFAWSFNRTQLFSGRNQFTIFPSHAFFPCPKNSRIEIENPWFGQPPKLQVKKFTAWNANQKVGHLWWTPCTSFHPGTRSSFVCFFRMNHVRDHRVIAREKHWMDTRGQLCEGVYKGHFWQVQIICKWLRKVTNTRKSLRKSAPDDHRELVFTFLTQLNVRVFNVLGNCRVTAVCRKVWKKRKRYWYLMSVGHFWNSIQTISTSALELSENLVHYQ